MGVATGYGCREVIDFLILLIPTPLESVLFCSSILLFVHSVKYIMGHMHIIIVNFT